jgi:hypothetical protein
MGRRLLALALGVALSTGWPAGARARTIAATAPNAYAEALAEGDARAKAGDDAAAIESWRSAYAAAAEDPAARRDVLARIGAAHQRRFEAQGDAAELRRAEASLADAAKLCDGPAADDVACASIRADLEQVQGRVAAIDRPSTQSGSGVPTSMQPAPPPVVQPTQPSPEVIDRSERMKSAENVAIAGYVFAGLGGATLLFVSVPYVIAAEIAEDRAEDNPILVSEEELYERRDNRLRVARISALIGGSSLLFGGIFIGTGLGIRHKIKKEAAVARAAPWFGPNGGGVAVVGRF